MYHEFELLLQHLIIFLYLCKMCCRVGRERLQAGGESLRESKHFIFEKEVLKPTKVVLSTWELLLNLLFTSIIALENLSSWKCHISFYFLGNNKKRFFYTSNFSSAIENHFIFNNSTYEMENLNSRRMECSWILSNELSITLRSCRWWSDLSVRHCRRH